MMHCQTLAATVATPRNTVRSWMQRGAA